MNRITMIVLCKRRAARYLRDHTFISFYLEGGNWGLCGHWQSLTPGKSVLSLTQLTLECWGFKSNKTKRIILKLDFMLTIKWKLCSFLFMCLSSSPVFICKVCTAGSHAVMTERTTLPQIGNTEPLRHITDDAITKIKYFPTIWSYGCWKKTTDHW